VISGLGFFEIIIIVLIVLMFFGSKELPRFIREAARMIGKLRLYSEKVRRELNEVTNITSDIASPEKSFRDEVTEKKNKLREICLKRRKSLTEGEHKQKSARIAEQLFETEEYKKAQTILMYAATKTEVQTEECIKEMLSKGNRVVLPYCYPNSSDMGIAEIKDYSTDVRVGEYKMLEPVDEIRNNFLKSDIQLVVCPGVGYDINGARLGRGKGCYDAFLKELKEKAPIVGFAYQCQMLNEDIPFDYHDIPMDMIITEEGIKRFGQDTTI
jgi:5-formyltetrahydrofolate cyclo-ligase